MAEAIGHAAGRAAALNNLGWDYARLGGSGADVPPSGARLCQEQGDRHGEASTWDNGCYAHHLLGDHGQAVER
jgi:hypothetical protein